MVRVVLVIARWLGLRGAIGVIGITTAVLCGVIVITVVCVVPIRIAGGVTARMCCIILILIGCRGCWLGLRVWGLQRSGIRNRTDVVVLRLISIFQGILVLGPGPRLVLIPLWVGTSIIIICVFFFNPPGRLGEC